ncbi:MAG: DUF3536 domain-containing protein [Candidatus Omnitrophica bacterium]|nr:DUF3536 domain-containing protein [Candidatus Omnitrophota bacterium]
MNKNICIHGHFYQPPREDAWTGVIEEQKSAAPFHDWNERITAECYRPNTESPIHGENNNPIKTVNNYEWISFNIGPTLFSWLEQNDPATYQKIIKADHNSLAHFKGYGSAIAQAYNHIIMPLANDRDKQTQVIWGIKDFEYRFRRKPLGMWLPETAVDLKTLEVLAENHILFTILAPKQAKSIKLINDQNWTSVNESTLNTKVAYLCRLPSGKTIHLFFYDGFISSELAFGKIIQSGVEIANHMLGKFDHKNTAELVHVATDGETYGHHRQFGNMALSYLIEHIQKNNLAKITNYALFLKEHKTEYEVEIHENTAWSSSVGVERWCAAGGGCINYKKSWTQKWRAPLREAMDWLRDELIPLYEKGMKGKGDPWVKRDHFIDDILHKRKRPPLLEMQHMAMLMYTSCGWFFDDISGIETVQILQYAARAMEIAKEECGVNLEQKFLKILSRARSNYRRKGTGEDIYVNEVKKRALHV